MRISDWSSDVCSSDLGRNEYCSSRDCSRAGPYSPSMDMPDTPAAELRPTLDRLRTGWQRNRPDARQRMDDLARLRDALKARSEEHTSELQYLMRTSYAVLSL